jgi:hypothetical protein
VEKRASRVRGRPLGNSEIFVRGLRQLLLFLTRADRAALQRAARIFDRACLKEDKKDETPGAEFSRIKFLMYRAYVHERLGETAHRKRLIQSGSVKTGTPKEEDILAVFKKP